MSSCGRNIFRGKLHCYLYNYCCRLQYSQYKNTLYLPQTSFPHKVNIVNRRERDRMIEAASKFEQLYSWQREQNMKYEYMLHDGPPYANGDVHIGHAVNKILKDITVRNKMLSGYKIHFVPGWDCHGLPIELKIMKEGSSLETLNNQLEIRKKAYEFSQKIKESQCNSFMEWGIVADWKNSYVTCSPSYVIQQLNAFQELFDQGIIFRDYKPVFWSPYNRTSLAEAELEYNTYHVSQSVYMKFTITKCPEVLKSKLGPDSCLHIVIWTTTPWSLPANQAVCYSADKMYSVVFCNVKKEYYLVAEDMISSLAKALQTNLCTISTFEGTLLKDVKYVHPLSRNRECSLLPAHHVTMSKGTGLVHMAPNHGVDDYIVAKREKLHIDACMVDENGCYTSDAGKELEGKFILDIGVKSVINLIDKDILCLEDYTHSYPYDWRSKTPVIIRSSHQWFIDVQQIREQAMHCLQNVTVFPSHLKKTFLNQLDSSPQWCISRQRVWGVPIPAFYDTEENKPVVNKIITDNLCNLIEERGIHCWWEMSSNELLPSHLKKKCNLPNITYNKGFDIMDIWFDSGISWKNVLSDPRVSDVCIEGIDQIRGWFNSSLLTSVALRGKAPYKALLLHGFTTDAEGHKMSKSEGNVISPTDIMYGLKDTFPAYGIDVLRWWVASHACQHENIAVKSNILAECAKNLNKVRNTFKFLLGSLYEFNPVEDCINPKKMRPLDLFMLHQLKDFVEKVRDEYNAFQYKNVARDIFNFITNEVSSFYCQLVKDRLYCESKYSVERLSCQTVIYFMLDTLVQTIGPICPHLGEEVVLHHPNKNFAKLGLFRSQWPCLKDFLKNTSSPVCIDLASQIRETILKTEMKTIDMHAYIIGSYRITEILQTLNENARDNFGLIEFFQVSELSLVNQVDQDFTKEAVVLNGIIGKVKEGSEPYTVILTKTRFEKCPRCRCFSSAEPSTLCGRCLNVINNHTSKHANSEVV